MERLIKYFKPDNYKIELFIDKHKGTARGRTTVTGEPLQDLVKLHAKGLTIDRVVGDSVELEYKIENNELTFKKSHNIVIDYHFKLNTNMMGCYLSSYQYESHEEKLVSTQFESHYARECFPCIDEPEAKATFDLEITVPDLDDTAISNTSPIKTIVNSNKNADASQISSSTKFSQKASSRIGISQINNSQKASNEIATSKTVIFATTPKMSTYLLAFCIGKFQSKSKTSKHGVKVTTYCALNQELTSVDFANDIATASLDFYDDAFGIAYPLEKLDQIAIPDFEAGAMENWGLVTYRESCLLSGDTATIDDRQYVATVIAHELSHQWFGDLVTMKWWDNLWLNESFATLMEYLCVDAIRPDYKILETFFIGECRAALNRDALPGVQAVQQDVNDPAEISTLFDGAIVYAKGAHLMFMLYRLMGARSFFAGLKEYFKQHQYQNTTGDDLWSALQPHAKFDVKSFMDAWILRPGYPVVTDGDQMRFLLTSTYEEASWPLPGESKTKASAEQKDPRRSAGVRPQPLDAETWPLPEVTDDMSGHYVLNLSAEEFAAKLENFEKLNFEQKVRLLLDRSLLAKTPLVSTAHHLELLSHFRGETDDSLWSPISGLVSDLKLFFPVSDPDYDRFKQYVYYIVEPQLNRLGYEKRKKESENDTKLRASILGLALFSENQAVLDQLAVRVPSDPETRYAVLYARLRTNEAAEFPKMLEKYQKTADPDLKDDYLSVLATAREHNADLLKLLKSPKIVRPQDHLYLFAYLLRNHKTQSAAMAWLYDNWGYIVEMNGEKSIEDYPRILASVIRNEEKAARFDAFIAEHSDDPILKRTLVVAKNEINARLRLISTDNTAVHGALRNLKF